MTPSLDYDNGQILPVSNAETIPQPMITTQALGRNRLPDFILHPALSVLTVLTAEPATPYYVENERVMRIEPLRHLLIAALLFFSACSTTTTNTTTEQTGRKRPDQYRTFAIAQLPNQSPSTDPGAAARLNEVARAAIIESLTSKGYTEAGPESADFIVKVQTEFLQDPIFENSEKRHYTIAFHDAKTDEVVWSQQRGRSSSRTLEPDLLRKSIAQMLTSVPSAASR